MNEKIIQIPRNFSLYSRHKHSNSDTNMKPKSIYHNQLPSIEETKNSIFPPSDLKGSPKNSLGSRRWEYSNSPQRSTYRTHLTSRTVKNLQSSRPSIQNNESRPGHIADFLSTRQVLSAYRNHLSNLEQEEILNYQQIYFIGFNVEKQENYLEKNGKYKIVLHDEIAFRYEILKSLGRGSFGEVVECYDHKREELVAVKILKESPKVKRLGELEVNFLTKIGENDLEDEKNIVKMYSYFEFRGHICIVFELLAINLFEFHEKRRFETLNLHLVRRIAIELLIGLKHIHSLNLIHCDLKPENIMFKNEKKTSIKIIDFGTALSGSAPLFYYIESRYYRAPEIILGCGYDNKIDIWSFGCILFELIAGEPLFMGENEKEELTKIVSVIGLPPYCVLQNSKRRQEFFTEDGTLKSYMSSRRYILLPGSRDLREMLDTDPNLISLIMGCLHWEPELRVTAEEALEHPWVKGTVMETRKPRTSINCK